MKILEFISEYEIGNKVREIANKIKLKNSNSEIIILSILKGSFIFTADLVRELFKINIKPEIHFLNAKSYDGFNSTGKVKINDNLSFVSGKHVIIVEDILDTGLTLKKLYEEVLKNNPESVEICVLLYKQRSRNFNIPIDYIGFKIPDKFVVGYGLDYNEKYRGLPYIGVIEKVENKKLINGL